MKKHMMRDLPKIRDSITFLYLEYGRLEKSKEGVQFKNKQGVISIPSANVSSILLGPGTTSTHGAIRSLASVGCSIIWCGEGGVRCYAQGIGETLKSNRLMHQAKVFSNPSTKLEVIRKMYLRRFDEELPKNLTLEQIRGREGIRVRKAYSKAASENGVEWHGRLYNRNSWKDSDPINRILSSANACLHGFVHAAILSSGYSPALGFIHQGKQLSFVYDIADLYKTETTIPMAFTTASENHDNPERVVRKKCRDSFFTQKLPSRIVNDIDSLLAIKIVDEAKNGFDIDEDPFMPTPWSEPKINSNGGIST